MRWVTYYESVMGGVTDVTFHKDKETAERFFKANYRCYFENNTPFTPKLPCSYGFPHRRFVGTSIVAYNKMMKEIGGKGK